MDYSLDQARLAPLLAAKPRRGGVWEADVFESPLEARDEEGVYRPLMTMIVETGTGLVLSSRMFGRAYRAIDALGDDLVSVMADRKALPGRLEVKDEETTRSLGVLREALGVCVEAGPLNALYAARRALGDARHSRRRDATLIPRRKRRR